VGVLLLVLLAAAVAAAPVAGGLPAPRSSAISQLPALLLVRWARHRRRRRCHREINNSQQVNNK
jgi:hypothetical protein